MFIVDRNIFPLETYRYRLCDYPTPYGTALDCGGSSNETETCSRACPGKCLNIIIYCINVVLTVFRHIDTTNGTMVCNGPPLTIENSASRVIKTRSREQTAQLRF